MFTPLILSIATGVPEFMIPQAEAKEIAAKQNVSGELKSVLPRIYDNTKINTRYMCVPDFQKGYNGELFFKEENYSMPLKPRIDEFKDKAVSLAVNTCEKAIKNANVDFSDIRKVIVVTSTGFYAPGLDCEIISRLGLERSVDRCTINFMGCAAAMNGIRVARDFSLSKPGKAALLCCVELSSVHTTFSNDLNDQILHALFADGCAAVVVKAVPNNEIKSGDLMLVDDHSYLIPNSEDGITLSIDSQSITCTLSKVLPVYIKNGMRAYIDSFLEKQGLVQKDIHNWAIHPGGPRIIGSVEDSLGLTPEQSLESWETLAKYGNMLSPSVLFVIELMQAKNKLKSGTNCLAFSFSPGVGVEGVLIKVA